MLRRTFSGLSVTSSEGDGETPRSSFVSPMRMLKKMASIRFASNNDDNGSSGKEGSGGGDGNSFSSFAGLKPNEDSSNGLRRPTGWNVMRRDVNLINRNDLEESVNITFHSNSLSYTSFFAHFSNQHTHSSLINILMLFLSSYESISKIQI